MFAGRDPFSGHRFWKGPLVHRVGNIVRHTNASKSMFYRGPGGGPLWGHFFERRGHFLMRSESFEVPQTLVFSDSKRHRRNRGHF